MMRCGRLGKSLSKWLISTFSLMRIGKITWDMLIKRTSVLIWLIEWLSDWLIEILGYLSILIDYSVTWFSLIESNFLIIIYTASKIKKRKKSIEHLCWNEILYRFISPLVLIQNWSQVFVFQFIVKSIVRLVFLRRCWVLCCEWPHFFKWQFICFVAPPISILFLGK